MRYMIVDSLNQFLRSLVVNPTLSPNGQPIGGVCGYLKTLQKLTKTDDGNGKGNINETLTDIDNLKKLIIMILENYQKI